MKTLFIIIVFKIIILLIRKNECQVILTLEILEKWYGENLLTEKILILSNRQIVSIEPQTFKGLIGLNKVNLRSNQLTSINSNIFNGLINLETLDFRTNQINFIDRQAFKGMNKLKN